jgi:hypothetical protein
MRNLGKAERPARVAAGAVLAAAGLFAPGYWKPKVMVAGAATAASGLVGF